MYKKTKYDLFSFLFAFSVEETALASCIAYKVTPFYVDFKDKNECRNHYICLKIPVYIVFKWAYSIRD
jgi:hypothetical protein